MILRRFESAHPIKNLFFIVDSVVNNRKIDYGVVFLALKMGNAS